MKTKNKTNTLINKLTKQMKVILKFLNQEAKSFSTSVPSDVLKNKYDVQPQLNKEYKKMLCNIYLTWAIDKIKRENEFIKATCYHFSVLDKQHSLIIYDLKQQEIKTVEELKKVPDGGMKNNFVKSWNQDTEVIPKFLISQTLPANVQKEVETFWKI